MKEAMQKFISRDEHDQDVDQIILAIAGLNQSVKQLAELVHHVNAQLRRIDPNSNKNNTVHAAPLGHAEKTHRIPSRTNNRPDVTLTAEIESKVLH